MRLHSAYFSKYQILNTNHKLSIMNLQSKGKRTCPDCYTDECQVCAQTLSKLGCPIGDLHGGFVWGRSNPKGMECIVRRVAWYGTQMDGVRGMSCVCVSLSFSPLCLSHILASLLDHYLLTRLRITIAIAVCWWYAAGLAWCLWFLWFLLPIKACAALPQNKDAVMKQCGNTGKGETLETLVPKACQIG